MPALEDPLNPPGAASVKSRSVPPRFGKNGKALTEEQRGEIARRRGVCIVCGIQTHRLTVVRRNITNSEVYKGHCIRHNQDLIPPIIYSEWKQKHDVHPSKRASSSAPAHIKTRSSDDFEIQLPTLLARSTISETQSTTSERTQSTGSHSTRVHRRTQSTGSYEAIRAVPSSECATAVMEPPTVLTVFEASPLAFEDENGKEIPLTTLELEKESSILKEALQGFGIQLSFRTATTNNLSAFLSHGQHQLLHLCCHGNQNYLFIENDYGGAQQLLVNDHLRPWIRAASGTNGGSKLRFVFVSACHSRSAGDAFVDAGIRHVVCCEQDTQVLNNTAAMIFTRDFYRSMAFGRSIQQAFNLAVHAVVLSPELKRTGLDTEKESKKFALLPFDADHNVGLFPSRLGNPSSFNEDLGLSERSSSGSHPLTPATNTVPTMLLPPVPPRFFTGRELDVYRSLKALFVRECRLVRITGPQGMGKATVAKAVGHYIAKRKMWGEILAWLPSTRKLAHSDGSERNSVSLLLKLVAAFDLEDGDAWSSIAQDVLDDLYEKKATIIINTKDMEEDKLQRLSCFLDDVFERTRHVKVILVCREVAEEAIKSKNRSGFSCPEAEISLEPLDFEATVSLFVRLCPHTPSSACSQEVLHQKKSPGVYQVMGQGIPACIRLVAKQMKRSEYKILIEPGSRISRDDFRASLSKLPTMPSFDDDSSSSISEPESVPSLGDDSTTHGLPAEVDKSQETPKDSLRSQAEMRQRFSALLKGGNKVYRKTATSFIRGATKGEHVVTALNGITETHFTVKDDNCWVVCARSAGEFYVLTDRQFRENYEVESAKAIDTRFPFPFATKLRSEGFLEYCSKRRILAHEVDEGDMMFIRRICESDCNQFSPHSDEAAQFIAPWSEPMRVELGDYLATTFPEEEDIDIYRIERAAFESTYADCGAETIGWSSPSVQIVVLGALGAILAVLIYCFIFLMSQPVD